MTLARVKKEEQLNIESLTLGDLTWVNIERPTKQEIDYLGQNYTFHRMALDDCLSRIQRPKIDEYEDYLFIVLLFPVWHKEIRVTTASQISIFVGKNYVITLHTGEFKPLNELFAECKNNESVCQENFSRGSVYLLYRAIDVLIDYGFRVVDKILTWAEEVEDMVFSENAKSAREVATLRRDIIAQRRIIWPLRTVIAELENKLQRFTTMDMRVYFGDLVDHINKIWDVLDECKEVVEVYKDAGAVMASNRVNEALRIMTILMTIGTFMCAFVSFFGMNIPMPGAWEAPGGNKWTVAMVILALLAMTAGMLFYFRRKRWL